MAFPAQRLRRLRRTDGLRRLTRETLLSPSDLVAPVFALGARDADAPIAAIPGVSALGGRPLAAEARALRDAGVLAVLVFGVPERGERDARASAASSPAGPTQQAVDVIKQAAPDLVVVTDLCLCEYTDSGHCGVLRGGEIDNDATLELLAAAAVAQAQAGSDVIAPSGVMDGTVQALRRALDGAGYDGVLTMPYSAKFASALYGPFKAATSSAPAESKHATHQIDPANPREALRKIASDVDEGADVVIVKPALTSLDVVARARERVDVPIAAYCVSGEHLMLRAAAGGDPALWRRLLFESLTCIRRAGADIIISYAAREAAEALRDG